MSATHTELYFHALFAVRDRKPLISKRMRVPLYTYINYLFRLDEQHLIAINGAADHLHLLFRTSPTKAIADLMRDVKALSSRYVNDNGLCSKPFYWERGYGAFSCSHAQVPRIRKMIEQQDTYHQHKTFHDEYLELMGELNIDFTRTSILNWFNVINR
ncbi:MAG: transposase [Saprospiraceae bacterium]|nr:transposase [Saprospiraceae bacterium]